MTPNPKTLARLFGKRVIKTVEYGGRVFEAPPGKKAALCFVHEIRGAMVHVWLDEMPALPATAQNHKQLRSLYELYGNNAKQISIVAVSE